MRYSESEYVPTCLCSIEVYNCPACIGRAIKRLEELELTARAQLSMFGESVSVSALVETRRDDALRK